MTQIAKSSMITAVFVAAMLACTPAFAVKKVNSHDDMSELDSMSAEFDALDKQDFQAAIDRANGCTRARDFSCSESELAKAAKVANSGQDRKALAAARQNIANEKTRIAEEERRRAEEARREAEAEERRQAAEERARERERQAQREREEREDREAARAADAANMAAIRANITDGMGRIAAMDRGIASAMAESRRVQAEQAAQRERERAQREAAAEEWRRDAERARRVQLASAEAERERRQQAEEERAREQERRQKAAQDAADRQAAEQQRAREREQQRQQQAKEKADQLAALQAERAATAQRQAAYLAALRQGIRLSAIKCMDGEGRYYAGGTMPHIKRELECVDVYYRAYCPGTVGSSGVARTFVGMSGCYGDTYPIDPKPACAVNEVRVDVTDVRPCGN